MLLVAGILMLALLVAAVSTVSADKPALATVEQGPVKLARGAG
jgi:hypothetical protein